MDTDAGAARPASGFRWNGRWKRGALILAGLGATLGVSLDAMHVWTGTTQYSTPHVNGLALWVFPLFATASILFGFARPFWERMLGWRSPRPSTAGAAAGLAFFVSAYLMSGLLPFSSSAVAIVLAAHAIAAWAIFDRSLLGVGLALSTAVFGTVFEASLIYAGGFQYLRPDFAGVALWLPLLYMTVAISVGNLGKALVDE